VCTTFAIAALSKSGAHLQFPLNATLDLIKMKNIINKILGKLVGNTATKAQEDKPSQINDAEEFLNSQNNWPQNIEGHFFYLDSGSVQDTFEYWMIGSLEDKRFNDALLVEFKGSILEDAGIDTDFEFSEPIKLWVNPAIDEYYQVIRIEI